MEMAILFSPVEGRLFLQHDVLRDEIPGPPLDDRNDRPGFGRQARQRLVRRDRLRELRGRAADRRERIGVGRIGHAGGAGERHDAGERGAHR